MKTVTGTVTSSAGLNVTVSDYTDAMIRVSGIWNGTLSFNANNTTGAYSTIAVQDIDSTNWTTAVTSEAGSSPSTETNMYRVPVSGLTNLAFVLGPMDTGSIDIVVTLISTSNAR